MHRKASLGDRGNKLWHGSRFVLPEHREAMRVHETETKKTGRPVLDPDKLDEMSWILADAIQEERPVTVTLYDPAGNRMVTVVPRHIDQAQRVLKGMDQARQATVMIPMGDILHIT